MLALSVKNLNKTIAHNNILKNISLDIEEGDLCGVMGRNASGKSMLFKCITGLATIDSGSIAIFGEPLEQYSSRPGKIGALIEYPGFLPQYSGYYNLYLLSCLDKNISKERICDIMLCLGLDPKSTKPYRKYSLGMRQKLGLASAIMGNPKLLILDEPTNNLDYQSVLDVRKLLLDIHIKNNTTILMASHNEDDIKCICKKVYELNDGHLIMRGE